MNAKDVKTIIGLLFFLGCLWTPLCRADEIFFQNQKGPQVGSILQEDQNTVTIRFPRESIRSMKRDKTAGSVQRTKTEYKNAAGLNDKMEALQERMNRLEIQLHTLQNERTSSISKTPQKETVTEQILSEEMGRVEGVIHWRGVPMDHGKVKIVLTNYTGFSLGALKKMFKANPETSSGQQEMSLTTQTDSQGRYVYDRVPPGQYRLYWQPDEKTGWVHRMRDKPDFEVVAGKPIQLDIPGKKK